jgi:DUF1680 family protein
MKNGYVTVRRIAMTCLAGAMMATTSVAAETGGGNGAAVPAKVPAKLDRPAGAAYQMGGPLQKQMQGVIDNWLLLVPGKNPAMLDMFADRDKQPYRDLLPWSGEFVGKYMTASVQMMRLTGNKELQATVGKVVGRLVTLQDADGYLGPYSKTDRLTDKAICMLFGKAYGTWDAWGHYHIMTGLMLWYDQTRDAKALDCARKIGDKLCARFLGNGRHVADMGSPDQNQAVIHSLCRLYEETGTSRYLELAEQIVAEFAIPGAGDYLRTALAGKEFYATPKPRWESLHAIMGLAELYRITGKEDYRKSFEHIWWSIVKLDRHNNGGFSTGEQAVGNPYAAGAIETCCSIAWIAMSVEMLRTTGNPIVADEMELSTLNSVVGLHSHDGAWCTYDTPMDGTRVPSTTSIAFQKRPGSEQLNCCSVNAARGFGMISDWALMQEAAPAALVLNWYGPSTISASVAGVPVTLRQETDYPRQSRIELHVEPGKETQFALKLRIPHWSAATKCSVNGKAVAAQAGTYCTLDRRWKPGDRVTLDLDMRLRAWVGERECAGKVSLYRGPLLLAHDAGARAPRNMRPGAWKHLDRIFASREKGTAFEHDFAGDSIKWFGMRFDDAGLASILIDGKPIARVDQYDPVRGKPFSWEHRGLSAGKHTIRIEVSGGKDPASKDTWSNVSGFGPAGAEQPTLRVSGGGTQVMDMATLDATLVEPSAETDASLVMVDVTDAAGQSLRLCDFGSAGRNGVKYTSWLPAKGASPTPFSPETPLRTSVCTSTDQKSPSR